MPEDQSPLNEPSSDPSEFPAARDVAKAEDLVAPNPLAEYNKRVSDWISDKWADGHRCPMCGTNQWVILPMAEIPVRSLQHLGLGIPAGQAFQVIPVLCTHCAFVAQLLAGPVGVLQPSDPSTGEDRT
jgi:hypothetical protein